MKYTHQVLLAVFLGAFILFGAIPAVSELTVSDAHLALVSVSQEEQHTESTKEDMAVVQRKVEEVAEEAVLQKDAYEQKKEEPTIVEEPQVSYPHPPLPFDAINLSTRAAIVNIFCTGALAPISASGVLIDERGIILTNAHVGQFFLLSEDLRIRLSCEIRTGAPARATYTAELLAISPDWVTEHAQDITKAHPEGTGEHDWALLSITGRTDGQVLEKSFPSVPVDVRQGAVLLDDEVLLAAYPAGFVGGVTAQYALYPASTVAVAQKLFTFSEGIVDLVSIGGVIVAQGGSSGGPMINHWGYLTGIITTSSSGESTEERDLRAVTTSHIDTSMRSALGYGLPELIAGNPREYAEAFRKNRAPTLADLLVGSL